MIKGSTYAMPKAALLLCYFFCGNFILSGYTAEQCPRSPLEPTSSVSGLVVGTIVGAEKLVSGVAHFFYYLGENSVNQVLSLTSRLEGSAAKLTLKAHDFVGGILGGIGGQLKTIYNGSTGSIRVIFDTIINMENKAQSYVYKQVENVSDSIMSGRFRQGIVSFIKSPFISISNGIHKAASSISKLSSNFKSNVKSIVKSVRTSGIPSDIKHILMAPVKGVQIFVEESKAVVDTVKNETKERFAGYTKEFKQGGIIDKLVALSSIPVGATLEVWSFTLKISEAGIKSVSAATKDVVQPFLGQVLTERLGTVVMLPLGVTEGVYKSTVNLVGQVGVMISNVTGGGSVGTQVNTVLKHPLFVAANAWKTTTEQIKAISNAVIGKELTGALGGVVGSPGKALSGIVSSIRNSQLYATLSSVVTSPMKYLGKAWTSIKTKTKGISRSVLGENLTAKLSGALSAPGKFISNLVTSITGGGSLSAQIHTVVTSPIQTLGRVLTTMKKTAGDLITSVTGGGSLSTQISTVLTSPLTVAKNIWHTTKETVKSVSKTVLGGAVTQKLGEAFSSPLSFLGHIYKSISANLGSFSASISINGGGITGALSSFIRAPIDVVKGTLGGLQSAWKTVVKGITGLYHSLPFVGKNASVKVGVKVGANGNAGGSSNAGGSFNVGGSSNAGGSFNGGGSINAGSTHSGASLQAGGRRQSSTVLGGGAKVGGRSSRRRRNI